MDRIISYWIDTTQDTSYPKIENDIDVDVAIVGGGITGITTAYLLNMRGVKLAVIDANRIAKGTSGHTTAKITSQHSLKYAKTIKSFGEEKAQQYATANETAIDMVEEIVNENNIDCDFKRVPAYVFTQEEEYIKKIEEETSAAYSLKLPAEYTDKLELPFAIKGAVKFSNQAQFHPRKYLLALASIIEKKGSLIFENTRAVDIQEGDPHILVTDSGKKISASRVVQATRYHFFDTPRLSFSRL
ncbi:MAG: FAD-binding oxidoreductase [Clostridiales bacterium]|nr:FAD-binding oxidoreductase [Clostridiales bacterium]